MDLRKIKKLIALAEEAGISELEVKSGDEAVRIVRAFVGENSGTTSSVTPDLIPAAVSISPARRAAKHISAPMAGTFYLAPEPGAEPFVQLGQQVQAGDIVCIIESMKMMNEIRSEADGIVTGVLVTNGQAVSAGEPLLQLS